MFVCLDVGPSVSDSMFVRMYQLACQRLCYMSLHAQRPGTMASVCRSSQDRVSSDESVYTASLLEASDVTQ